MDNTGAQKRLNYRVGIDVGTHSVGLAAIEMDDAGIPISILSAVSHIHDSGVLEAKTATTRLAAAGVARRMRRLRRKRVKRLVELDRWMKDQGWDEPAESNDPYAPWRARSRLATERIEDQDELGQLLVLALRHMARHRGWRNPWERVGSLHLPRDPSEFFLGYRQRVEDKLGVQVPIDATVSELAVMAIDGARHAPLRMGRTPSRQEKSESFFGGKLHQADNANEIHAYATTQAFSADLTNEIIDHVFAADSPRGSYVNKIGKDPLNGQPRAAKATDSFQRFRILSVLANVRVKESGSSRPLTHDERKAAYELLVNAKVDDEPTWAEVGNAIGLARGALSGAASLDDEGLERLPARPPINVTDHRFRKVSSKLKSVKEWWLSANSDERDALVLLLVDGQRVDDSPESVAASELLDSLDEEALSALDNLDLPAGRASYSIESLRMLSTHLRKTTDDLHESRKAIFGVDDSWVPPSDPINAPIGNPAVDRVTKIVGRWLAAAESEWGAPSSVTLEHVREAFMSMDAVRQRESEARRRYEANEKARLAIKQGEKDDARVRMSDVRRYDAILRQKGQCAYCGDTITFATSEMDHIVPRKGAGSTNTRTNLIAACIPCNRSKGNLPFAVWAGRSDRDGVSVDDAVSRVRFWTKEKALSPRSWSMFKKEVCDRLTRTEEDPEIDGRSMESVAWMANELRDRIAAHFRETDTTVAVYQGAITAGARQAAGIAEMIPFIGGGGKTRLDRRHHAVDAAVVSLLDPSVAKTLAERNSMRTEQRSRRYESEIPRGDEKFWGNHIGSTPAAADRFATWKIVMGRLADLLIEAFSEDRVVVMQNLRLRLGNGKVHDDTIHPFTKRYVGSAMTRDEVDAASTPALWTALTRDPDFDPVAGLPENPERRIRIHGSHYGPDDEIDFFDKPRAALAVRGGWAALGDSIHHARIYRWEERGKTKYGMLRVYAADLRRHAHEDLFSVKPQPSWISMRIAHPSIGRSDPSTREYVGWLVAGDEIFVRDEIPQGPGLGAVSRWRVRGFEDSSRFNVSPTMLAEEGLERFIEGAKLSDEDAKGARDLVAGKGRRAVNLFFNNSEPIVVRRDALGRPRTKSRTGLPSGWEP